MPPDAPKAPRRFDVEHALTIDCDYVGMVASALAKAMAKAAAVARHSTELDALDGLIAVLEKLPESDQTRAQRIAVAVARRETTNTGLTAALTATRAAEQVLADVQPGSTAPVLERP